MSIVAEPNINAIWPIIALTLIVFHWFVHYFQESSVWGKTEFEVKTNKAHRLPIIDIATYITGDTKQEFELNIGEVCFR